MIQQATKVLGIFGGGAVLFYAIGFTVVKTYIAEIDLDGMIWFTREFYVDAGASFLLEIINAPYENPLIFLPYVLVLYLLVPKKSIEPKSVKEAVLGRVQIAKLSVLSTVTMGTLLFIYVYGTIKSGTSTFDPTELFIYLIIRGIIASGDAESVFFTFTIPLAIVLGVFLYRFRGLLKGAKVDRMIHQGAVVVYVVYLMYLPIFYGKYIYDWQLSELKDHEIVERILSGGEKSAAIDFGTSDLYSALNMIYSAQATVHRHIWLIGEFGDNYYFLTKVGLYGNAVIEIIDTGLLDRLNLDPYNKASLRAQMDPRERPPSVALTEIRPSFKEEIRQKRGRD